MERLWSQARATSRNQLQMAPLRKRLKQAGRQPVATHGNRFRAHGKEGVNAEALSKSTVPNPVPNQTSRPDTASSRNQKRPALRAFSRMDGTGLEPMTPSLSIVATAATATSNERRAALNAALLPHDYSFDYGVLSP
jgi:hypothetical protein